MTGSLDSPTRAWGERPSAVAIGRGSALRWWTCSAGSEAPGLFVGVGVEQPGESYGASLGRSRSTDRRSARVSGVRLVPAIHEPVRPLFGAEEVSGRYLTR